VRRWRAERREACGKRLFGKQQLRPGTVLGGYFRDSDGEKGFSFGAVEEIDETLFGCFALDRVNLLSFVLHGEERGR